MPSNSVQQGARGLADRSSVPPDAAASPPALDTMHSLDEICAWIGTFQERLRIAHETERPGLAARVKELEARYRQRRAELA